MKINFFKSTLLLTVYTLAGAVGGVLVGYLGGACGGLVLSFYNNYFLPDAPLVGYFWWANFLGVLIAVFTVLPSAGLGLLFGFIKTSESEREITD